VEQAAHRLHPNAGRAEVASALRGANFHATRVSRARRVHQVRRLAWSERALELAELGVIRIFGSRDARLDGRFAAASQSK